MVAILFGCLFAAQVGQTVSSLSSGVQPLVAPTSALLSLSGPGFPTLLPTAAEFYLYFYLFVSAVNSPFLYIWRTAGSKEQWGQDGYAGLQVLDLPRGICKTSLLLSFFLDLRQPGVPVVFPSMGEEVGAPLPLDHNIYFSDCLA